MPAASRRSFQRPPVEGATGRGHRSPAQGCLQAGSAPPGPRRLWSILPRPGTRQTQRLHLGEPAWRPRRRHVASVDRPCPGRSPNGFAAMIRVRDAVRRCLRSQLEARPTKDVVPPASNSTGLRPVCRHAWPGFGTGQHVRLSGRSRFAPLAFIGTLRRGNQARHQSRHFPGTHHPTRPAPSMSAPRRKPCWSRLNAVALIWSTSWQPAPPPPVRVPARPQGNHFPQSADRTAGKPRTIIFPAMFGPNWPSPKPPPWPMSNSSPMSRRSSRFSRQICRPRKLTRDWEHLDSSRGHRLFAEECSANRASRQPRPPAWTLGRCAADTAPVSASPTPPNGAPTAAAPWNCSKTP
jgi:hypothetical protein